MEHNMLILMVGRPGLEPGTKALKGLSCNCKRLILLTVTWVRQLTNGLFLSLQRTEVATAISLHHAADRGGQIGVKPDLTPLPPHLSAESRRSAARVAYSATRKHKDVTMIWKALAILAAFGLSACGGSGASVQATPPPQQSKPLSNVVAFMGDSITALWDLPLYDSGQTINLGILGATTIQMLAQFDTVIAASPGVVVILGGINDFHLLGPAATNIDSIKAMAAQAKAAGIRVILCSVMPETKVFQGAGAGLTMTDIEEFNQKIINLAQANGYLYADYYDEFLNHDGTVNNSLLIDGLHPNAAGYAVMWRVIQPLITEQLN